MSDVRRYTWTEESYPPDGMELVAASDYDAIAARLSDAENERDVSRQRACGWRDKAEADLLLARQENERLRAALRDITHVGPLGVDTYPECYKRIQAIVRAALDDSYQFAILAAKNAAPVAVLKPDELLSWLNNDRFVGAVRGTPGDDAAIAAKDAENERLRAALREYGNHVSPCATERSPKLLKEFGLMRWPCTCGFDAALATAETEVKP